MPPHSIISFNGAGFSYREERPVFDALDLSIERGSFVCLVGGNGSGKSTIARHMNALLAPSAGAVVVLGHDTRDAASALSIRSRTGMVFQNPDDQLVASLVENEVAFGPENLGVERAEIRARVDDALRAVGLTGFERREVSELSGGQKQRLALAGVLAMRPDVLILDEASAMLDPRGRDELARTVHTLRKRGTTVVSITHFMEEAAAADRIIVIEAGRIVLDGPPARVLTDAALLARLRLEAPFACRVSSALRSQGAPIPPCLTADDLEKALVEAHGCDGDSSAHDPAHRAARTAQAETPGAPAVCPSASPQRGRARAHGGSAAEGCAGAERPSSDGRHSDVVLSLQDVWFSYHEQNWALKGVSFAVKRGELLGIAGHTGSGKSTLIRHFNGLLRPTRGIVSAFGDTICDDRTASRVRWRTGVVFQYPEQQLFASTVYDDIAFGARNRGLDAREVDRRVRRALDQVELSFDEVAARSPFELSGGQQRRVALAGVLAVDPETIVLDEPTAGLDPLTRAEVLSLVENLRESGLTVIMVSHAMADLADLADRILVLDGGCVHACETPAEVFADQGALKRIGLDVPAAQQMAARLKGAGFALPRALYNERSLVEDLANAACLCKP